MSPFGLKTNGTYRKAIGIWDTALKELTQSFLLSVTEQRQQIKNFQGLWMAFQEHPCSSIPTPDSCFSPSCSGMWNAHAWGVRSWPRPNHISDQSRVNHCQCMLWCTHSGGSKTIPRMRSLRPELPPLCTLGEEGGYLHGWDCHCWSTVPMHTWAWETPAQWCNINPSSPDPASNQAACPGEKWSQHRIAVPSSQDLVRSKPRRTASTIKRKPSPPGNPALAPQAPVHSWWGDIDIAQRRSPNLLLCLALDPQTLV